MDDFICIKTFNTRIEAEMARQLLESNGIQARMSADDAGGMRPPLLTGSGGAKLFVSKKKSKKALSLLKAVK